MPLRTEKTWFGVVLQCTDAAELARFYQRLLGWTIFKEAADWATLAPSRTAGHNLAFQRDPDYVAPVWPGVSGQQQMQSHLDLEVDDLAAATAYAIECGAELAEFQPQDDVRVLLDPSGHLFCLYLDPDDVTG